MTNYYFCETSHLGDQLSELISSNPTDYFYSNVYFFQAFSLGRIRHVYFIIMISSQAEAIALINKRTDNIPKTTKKR